MHGVTPQRRAIFFDRDGVLNKAIVRNDKPYPPQSVDELVIVEGAFAALSALKSEGFLLIGVTNQPDVARGTTTLVAVSAINTTLLKELPLEEMYVCYHDDKHNCECRKPRPGLLFEAAKKHGINLAESIMIGDRWRDIDAGRQAGCKTVWINCHYNEPTPSNADFVTTTLTDAVNWIISTQLSRRA
jgi:D-glycero-D-manno-heptose 1,7-bisphosphate phosphatase